MKLRPIEASFQVANRATVKRERHTSSVCGDAVALIAKPAERNARTHSINRFARLRVA